MKTLPLAFAAAAMVHAARPASAAGPAEPVKYPFGVTVRTLDNGMDVITVENHSLPLVTIELAAKNGAYTETPEFNGLSHLYEHMFFKSNKVIPSQEAYMERLRELGARWNGTTSDERVNYFMTIHKKNLRDGVEFLMNALRYPLFKEEELRREWPVVLGEFDRNEADPHFHLSRETDRLLWHKYYSSKNAIGDRDVIFKASQEQMREIQSRYYVPNNCAVFVAGDVEPAEVYKLANEMFGDWARSDDPHKKWPEPEHPPLEKNSRIVVTGPIKTASVSVSWHGPRAKEDTESTYALDVLGYILGQPDSKFQRALVDSGLVDGVGVSYYTQVHTGPISLEASTSPDRLDNAWKTINEELAKIPNPDYITDEQIEVAKNALEIQDIYSREVTSSFVTSLSFWWATVGLDYYMDYLKHLRGVKREDLVRAYDKYIKDKPRVEAALVGPDAVEKLEFAKTAKVITPESGSSIKAFAARSAGALKEKVEAAKNAAEAAPAEAPAAEKPGAGEGVKTEKPAEKSAEKPAEKASAKEADKAGKAKGVAPDADVAVEEFDVDGLKVVLKTNPANEIVVAQMALMGGLPFYGKDQAGVELTLLETLDKGSKGFSKEDIDRQMAKTGASMSVEARQDYSVVTLMTLKRFMDDNFKIFADVISNPLLTREEVKLAVDRRLNAIQRMEQNPDSFISLLNSRNFFKGRPYEVPPSGVTDVVKGLDSEALKAYHAKALVKSRMKLFVVGALGKDEVAKMVRAGFAGLPKGEYKPAEIPGPDAAAHSLLTQKLALPTNYVMGGFVAPAYGTEDYYALLVATSILDDRMFEEVRTKRNLSYAVAASLSSRKSNYGALYVTTVKPNEAIKVMLDEVAKVVDAPISEKELRDKKEEMITGDLMKKQSNASQAASLLTYDMVGPGWKFEDGAIEKLRSITPEQAQAASAKYLKDFSFVELGDPDQVDATLFKSK